MIGFLLMFIGHGIGVVRFGPLPNEPMGPLVTPEVEVLHNSGQVCVNGVKVIL